MFQLPQRYNPQAMRAQAAAGCKNAGPTHSNVALEALMRRSLLLLMVFFLVRQNCSRNDIDIFRGFNVLV